VFDPRVKSAYAKVQNDLMAQEQSKNPESKKTPGHFHKEAVQIVNAAPWDYIVMTDEDRGYCGLGAKP
jgi:UDP-2,3-diacylglucosamine pyrophosphatase LpxH